MSMTFTKLFSSITESTVWCEPDPTRITWIAMLAMADAKGRVWASIPGLANRARVSVEEAERAINTFLSPDKYSRTPEHEGRRIEVIDGGWRLLNHEKYRAIRDAEAAKESKRDYINKRRAAERDEKAKGVENVDRGRTESSQAEADKEAVISSSLRSEDKSPAGFSALRALCSLGVDEKVAKDWIATRKVKLTQTALDGFVREAQKAGMSPNDAAAMCCQRGWRGFKAEWVANNGNGSNGGTRPKSRHDVQMETAAGLLGPRRSPVEREINPLLTPMKELKNA